MFYPRYKAKQKFFDTKAPSWQMSPEIKIETESIFQYIDTEIEGRILDMGCGTGLLFPSLSHYYPDAQIIGIDLSFEMLRHCFHRISRRRHILQGISEQLPLRDNTVDLILNYCCFPHIIHKNKALREYYRVLKPGKKCYIIHPRGSHSINHCHRSIGYPVADDLLPSLSQAEKLLQQNRFQVDQALDRHDIYLVAGRKN